MLATRHNIIFLYFTSWLYDEGWKVRQYQCFVAPLFPESPLPPPFDLSNQVAARNAKKV